MPPPATPDPPTPKQELPDWVMSSVMAFLDPFFAGQGPAAQGYGPGWGVETEPRDFVREVERRFHVTLPWGQGRQGAGKYLWQKIQEDRALLAKVLDYALNDVMMGLEPRSIHGAIEELDRALEEAGANYTVVRPDPNNVNCRLERRATLIAATAVLAQSAIGGSASEHLDTAWKAAFGRDPNPTHAYAEAVKAVEAVAVPLVLPNDSDATLGKVIGHIRANAQSYSLVFTTHAEAIKGSTLTPVQAVIAMTDLLWSNQPRHAEGDSRPAVAATQPQAELAVHIALTLVHTFRSAVS